MGLRNECFERGQRIAALERENAELHKDLDDSIKLTEHREAQVEERAAIIADLRARLAAAEENTLREVETAARFAAKLAATEEARLGLIVAVETLQAALAPPAPPGEK